MKFLFLFFWLLIISFIYFHTTDSFDQDLGRHLKLGEIIWETHEVPRTNLFSYTNSHEPVFNSHWGSQVIFYAVHQVFGTNGLILFSTIVNTAAFGLLGWLALKRVGIVIPSLLFIAFLFILTDRTWIRPELFGNLFYAIILITIFSKRVRNILKWFFPIIALLWVNLHISWMFGVFVMAVVLLQDALERRKIGVIRVIRGNGVILLLLFSALLINPYGLDGIISALTVLNKYGYTIVENQSLLFLSQFGFPLVSHIFFGVLVLLISYSLLYLKRRKVTLAEAIIVFVITALTLRFVRNEIFFAYTAFIVSAFNLGPHLSSKKGAALSGLLLVVSLILIVNINNSNDLPTGFGNREKYKEGVDFFIENNIQGPVFNDFDIGGYLIYRLYPQHLVFVDNRPEAYPVSFFQKIYKPMQENEAVFNQYAKQYNIKSIIWSKHDGTPWSRIFLTRISKDERWEKAYEDGATIIYVKKLID